MGVIIIHAFTIKLIKYSFCSYDSIRNACLHHVYLRMPYSAILKLLHGFLNKGNTRVYELSIILSSLITYDNELMWSKNKIQIETTLKS